MDESHIVNNLDVFILAVLVHIRNISHIFLVERIGFLCKSIGFGSVVDEDVVIHAVRTEIVAIDISIFHVEGKSCQQLSIVVARRSCAVVERRCFRITHLIGVRRERKGAHRLFRVVFVGILVTNRNANGILCGEFSTRSVVIKSDLVFEFEFVVAQALIGHRIYVISRLIAAISAKIFALCLSQILSTGHLYLIAIDGKLDPSIFEHASRRKTFDINIIAINAAIEYARRRATGIGNLILLFLSTGRRRNESAGQSGEGKRPRAMFVPFFVFIGYAKYDGAARRIFHFEFRAVPSKIDLTRFARNNISVAGLHHTLCVEIVLRAFASLFIVIILHIRIDELWQFSHVFSIAHLIEFQPSVARE